MSFPRYPKYKDFGVEWLGEVPEGWIVTKTIRFFKIAMGQTILKEDLVEDGEWPVFSATEGDHYFGRVNVANIRLIPGDIVIPARGNSIGAVKIVKEPCTTTQTTIYCHQLHGGKLLPKYVFHYLKGGKENLFYFTQTAIPQITVEEVGSNPILIPPYGEQQAIADFLDRETAKIDALVAEQENLIALLKEKRQAVISHAVTKGLDPTVPMKDSGIEWLGEVPAHWKISSLGRITTSRCDGPFGSGLKSEHYTDFGVRVIRLQNIRLGSFDNADFAYIDPSYYEDKLTGHEVVHGDVLIAGLGDERNMVGRACVAPIGIEPAMVKADCFRFRLDFSIACSGFIAVQLSVSASHDAGVLSTGSTRSRIPLSAMGSRKIAYPPVEEQKEIIAYLNTETAKLDDLTTEAQHTIDLLKERRSALISAAVTGKIDVRGYHGHSQATT